MKALFSILQWIFVIICIIGIWYAVKNIYRFSLPQFQPISIPLLLLSSLSIAFIVVNVWKPFSFKPFNCMKCFTAWCALLLGLTHNYAGVSILLFFIGGFIGAMFDAIKNRYL